MGVEVESEGNKQQNGENKEEEQYEEEMEYMVITHELKDADPKEVEPGSTNLDKTKSVESNFSVQSNEEQNDDSSMPLMSSLVIEPSSDNILWKKGMLRRSKTGKDIERYFVFKENVLFWCKKPKKMQICIGQNKL